MSYFRIVYATAALIVLAAAGLNFYVDPAGVFRKDVAGSEHYAEELLAADVGLWWPENSYEDRQIKKALARHAASFDCVVIGSSHVMALSSRSHPPALEGLCRRTLNLGVSGASLEDHFALAYMVQLSGGGRRMILGMAPWTLAFGKDQRWSTYAGEYRTARQAVLEGAGAGEDVGEAIGRRIANLFTLEYTLRSLQVAMAKMSSRPPGPVTSIATPIDDFRGGEQPALRPDGSLIYSTRGLAEMGGHSVPLGGVTYKTGGGLNQKHAVDAYRSFIRWLKANGSEPILLLTPYHQNVLKAPQSPNAIAIRDTEPLLREMARAEGIRVIGSYDPAVAGCEASDFIDFMHANSNCLAKLR